jgi:hypothetical protein
MSDQLVASPLSTQDNTTQKDENKHPCLKRDSKPRSSVRAIKDRAAAGSASKCVKYVTERRSQWLELLLRILGVLGSNLGPETGYSEDFRFLLQSLQANAGIVT